MNSKAKKERFTDEEIDTIDRAAETLDALWDLDAARGQHDSRPGAEYHRLSLGHRLRRLFGEEDA
jgi:hypothetical protein